MDTDNDPFNCGACNNRCMGLTTSCVRGVCRRSICEANVFCQPSAPVCCGNNCCATGQLCCYVGSATDPSCVTADAGSACP